MAASHISRTFTYLIKEGPLCYCGPHVKVPPVFGNDVHRYQLDRKRLDQNWLENTNIEFVSLTFQSGAVTLSRRSNLPRLMPLLWSSNVADVLYHLPTIHSHRNQLINLGTHHLPVKASWNKLHLRRFFWGIFRWDNQVINAGALIAL